MEVDLTQEDDMVRDIVPSSHPPQQATATAMRWCAICSFHHAEDTIHAADFTPDDEAAARTQDWHLTQELAAEYEAGRTDLQPSEIQRLMKYYNHIQHPQPTTTEEFDPSQATLEALMELRSRAGTTERTPQSYENPSPQTLEALRAVRASQTSITTTLTRPARIRKPSSRQAL